MLGSIELWDQGGVFVYRRRIAAFRPSCGIIVPAEEKVRKTCGFKGLSRVFRAALRLDAMNKRGDEYAGF
jgi:hypothetical protein